MKDALESAKAGVRAAFAADSLALAPHWIYDVNDIKNRFGRVESLLEPAPDSHHHGKRAGDFTHYGDQMLVLLESLKAAGGFDLQDFFRRWRLLFTDYGGYLDMATRTTLKNIENGDGPENSGSKSRDLAGASRFAPLLAFCFEDLDALVHAARKQTKMTHDSPMVIDSAEFFARAAHAVIHGFGPIESLRKAADNSYLSLPAKDWVETGIKFSGTDTVSATLNFGQSCNVDGAFRSTIQVIARHAGDPAKGLIDTVMAGGDSAARGILAGLILAADHDASPPPSDWMLGLRRKEAIEDSLGAA